MKSKLTILIAVIIAALLLMYMVTYQVRYDQVAVATFFDKIGEDGVKTEPGLYLRAPWPIGKVSVYTQRVQLLEDQLEEQQTADGYAVIINTYLAWRVQDPAKFFIKLKNEAEAQKQLKTLLRDMRGIISRYRFNELVNTDPEQLKLVQIEEDAVTALQNRLDEQGYGIAIERVGIRRILLPEKVTEKVFERMRQTRQRIAENTRQEGKSKADAIRSEAKSAQQRILAFAERRAQAIRSEGDREAATYYEKFKANEQFAIFQRQVEALKKMLAHNTTFVLDANNLSILELMKHDGVPQAAATPTVEPDVQSAQGEATSTAQ